MNRLRRTFYVLWLTLLYLALLFGAYWIFTTMLAA